MGGGCSQADHGLVSLLDHVWYPMLGFRHSCHTVACDWEVTTTHSLAELI